jgi:signal transduction histidine kinase
MMPRPAAPPIRTAWLRATRPTARLRLTLLYGTLFLLSGTALLAVTYLLAAHATAAITLNKGTGEPFGGAPGNPASPPPTPQAAGNHTVHLTNSQFASLQAQITHRHDTAMHELLIGSGLTLAGLTALSIASGWLVAGRVLRPVRTISATARQISASNLHERLSLDGPDDEFRELAATLDGLLERLQASFDSQRRFVANASHELRTPLTLDRALLERALRRRAPTQAFWRATCERLLASSKQQDRLIEALLTLARSEGAPNRHEPFELGAVIDTVLLSPELDTANAGLRIQTHIGPAPVNGDPRLVERLVRNLVDNAIRYNQPAGSVDIATAAQPGRTILTVANTGPAIPAADIDRLFQPFQRLTPDRSSHTGGTGLGLSIAKAIADAHSATVTAAPRAHGGLKIQVSFPAARRT